MSGVKAEIQSQEHYLAKNVNIGFGDGCGRNTAVGGGDWLAKLEAGLERCSGRVFAVLLVLIALAVIRDAVSRPFFYDELFTVHVARLPNSVTVCKALLAGADDHPPLDYLIRHLAIRMFGQTELGVRMPTIISFLTGLICVFLFTRRAMGGIAALITIAISVMCYNEMILIARPYGILMGVSGGMLLAWQSAIHGARRRLALSVLAVLCVVAPLLHYYGILLICPVMVMELVRTYRRQRFDSGIWIAIGCTLLPLPILVPFIMRARIYAAGFWTFPQTGRMNLPIVYADLFWRLVICFVIAIPLWVITRLCFVRRPGQAKASYSGVSLEVMGAVVLLLSPVFVFVLAVTVTNASSFHYSSQTVYGGGLLTALLALRYWRLRCSLVIALIPCLAASLWDIASATDPCSLPPTMELLAGRFLPFSSERPTIESSRKSAAELEALAVRIGLPVVFGAATQYIRTCYYAEPGSEFVYLANRSYALSILKFDTVDLGISKLAPFAGLNVVSYDDFLRKHRQFVLVLQDPRSMERALTWLPTKLKQDRARLLLIDPKRPNIFLVSLDGTVSP